MTFSALSRPISPEMRGALHERADAAGCLRFDAFVETVLYHPRLGYYRRPEQRIGKAGTTDFYTATSLGNAFGHLVAEAATKLLPSRLAPSETAFVEIGAEKGRTVLDSSEHPFAEVRAIAAGEPLELPPKSVVFSNELFDAQPFRRFTRIDGEWRERGVALTATGLTECLLTEADDLPSTLPAQASEGYCVDLPTGAQNLTTAIASRPWSGLFLAIDYGKTRQTLFSDHPEGTARAYFRHRQTNDLLANAGQQDLTCHICWDDLEEALLASGFTAARLERQEAFFMHHAAVAIEAILAADAAGVGAARRQLMELLHPNYFGTRFHVLSAVRV